MVDTVDIMTIHVMQLEAELVSLRRELEKERGLRKDEEARDALLLEYELKQQTLQQQLQQLKQHALEARCPELQKFLLDEGLRELGEFGAGEQVAFLLVERARLLDVIGDMRQTIIRLNQSLVSNLNIHEKNHPSAQDHHQDNFQNQAHQQQNPHQQQRQRHQDYQDHLYHHSDPDILPCADKPWSVEKIKDLLQKVSKLEEANMKLQNANKTQEKIIDEGNYYKINENSRNKNDNCNNNNENKIICDNTSTNKINNYELVMSEYVRRVEELEQSLRLRDIEAERLKLLVESLKGIESTEQDNEENSQLHRQTHTHKKTDKETDKGWDGEREEEGRIEVVLRSLEEQLRNIASDDKRAQNPLLAQQFKTLHKEFELLKVELVKMISKYDIQANRFREHKLTCQNRLFKIREDSKREKEELEERLGKSERRLLLLQESGERDDEYRERLEDSVHKLIEERKASLKQISSLEETLNEQRMKVLELQRTNNKLAP